MRAPPWPFGCALPRLLLAGLLSVVAPVRSEQITLAVLNFAQTRQGPEQAANAWMQKGLADLLINDLTTFGELRVVTREQMQMLLQEADFTKQQALGLPANEQARLRGLFTVDQLVFGTYTVGATNVTLQAQVIRRSNGEVLTRLGVAGALTDVLNLEKALARLLLDHFALGRAPAREWALPQWTDSTAASQRLYEGIDQFDRGDYNQAWHTFRQALRIAPDYADARYWVGRMHYYRQDYAHASIDYRAFVYQYPRHARTGDAVMELIHSVEMHSEKPEDLLALYRTFRSRDWGEARVHNQADGLSLSPLSDWMLKREQAALSYLGRYQEAFDLLAQEVPADTAPAEWHAQTRRLMASMSELSADTGGPSLAGRTQDYADVRLTADHPSFEADLRDATLRGGPQNWGTNYRFLAPSGSVFRAIRAEIRRTNDPDFGSICRLQVRRYRYVDINSCFSNDKGAAPGKRYTFDIPMPPGCTWFYLRPEYDGHGKAKRASFDGWRVEADFSPIRADAGGAWIRLRNASSVRMLIDNQYTRCHSGPVANLAPGRHRLRVEGMYAPAPCGYEPLETDLDIVPGEIRPLSLTLRLTDKTRTLGWSDPVALAELYPTYKHRPRRGWSWRNGAPAVAANRSGGKRTAIWSHLDDLWCAVSTNGRDWNEPVNLPAPVNSAHTELAPRLIADTRGRLCLLFLSDRGVQRNLCSYACWSSDAVHWSRPVLVSPRHHNDISLIEDQTGTYLLASATAAGSPGETPGVELRRSSDLVSWSAPSVVLPGTTIETVGLAEDDQGRTYLAWNTSLGMPQYAMSTDLETWSLPASIPCDFPRLCPCRRLSLAIANRRLYVGLGSYDAWYSGAETFSLVSRPIGAGPGNWEKHPLPPRVVDGMASLSNDCGPTNLLITWQVTDLTLDSEQPSGPVYMIAGTPGAPAR